MQNQKLSIQDLQSILESALLAFSRPLSSQELLRLFHSEKIPFSKIKKALCLLSEKYQSEESGFELKEVAGASWQLRTKQENRDYIRRLMKGRMFQLSAPAMEALVIVAYRGPCKKTVVDEIRGVESGHLLKTLMEKELICFGPKSEEPGRYMTYKTTPRFLEVFGLKSLKNLPSAKDIRDLLSSEDIPQETAEKQNLSQILNHFKSLPSQESIKAEWDLVSGEISSVKTSRPEQTAKYHTNKDSRETQ